MFNIACSVLLSFPEIAVYRTMASTIVALSMAITGSFELAFAVLPAMVVLMYING